MSTIAKAIRLLDFFSEARPRIGLTEFQRISGRDKATLYRHLTSLSDLGLIEQDPRTRAYRLGFALERLADMRRRTVGEADSVADIVDALSRASGELTHVSRWDDDRMAQVYHADLGQHAVRVEIEAGLVLPLLTTSSGKAVVAFLPKMRRARIIAQQHERFGSPPMPPAETFAIEIECARERGYVTSFDTLEEGVSSVGIPIFGSDALPIAAVSIAFPSSRRSPAFLARLIALLAAAGPSLTDRYAGRVPTPLIDTWTALAAKQRIPA